MKSRRKENHKSSTTQRNYSMYSVEVKYIKIILKMTPLYKPTLNDKWIPLLFIIFLLATLIIFQLCIIKA